MYTRYNTQKPVTGIQLRPDRHWSKEGLVGCWLMNEGGGDSVFDLSGNGLIGTLSADCSWVSGQTGQAVDLPGVTDYITASAPSQYSDGCSLTYIVKFKGDLGSDGGDQGLIRCADTFLKIDNGNNKEFVWYPDVDISQEDCAYPTDAGVWYVAAVTQVGTECVMYMNGIAVNSATVNVVDMTSSTGIILGAYNTTGTWDFDGQIGYVYLFNRALSASEIAQLYREPYCMFYRNDIGWWKSGAVPTGNAGIMTTNTGYWGVTY